MKLFDILLFTVAIFLNSIELTSQKFWQRTKIQYPPDHVFTFSGVYAYISKEFTELEGSYLGGVRDGYLFGIYLDEKENVRNIFNCKKKPIKIEMKYDHRSTVNKRDFEYFPFLLPSLKMFSSKVNFVHAKPSEEKKKFFNFYKS
ncbi:uncharacterized protein LOC117180306 [Belonocnema kinseyi]|uniref:uncharacterized protein LOC117180306 n=1 Tax=Belonocnema kinseyi TaxID=2817044 RepID=UPI00143D6450|nr:uncharacterized protein LOC117180306 [Belonocnema kinseyi]